MNVGLLPHLRPAAKTQNTSSLDGLPPVPTAIASADRFSPSSFKFEANVHRETSEEAGLRSLKGRPDPDIERAEKVLEKLALRKADLDTKEDDFESKVWCGIGGSSLGLGILAAATGLGGLVLPFIVFSCIANVVAILARPIGHQDSSPESHNLVKSPRNFATSKRRDGNRTHLLESNYGNANLDGSRIQHQRKPESSERPQSFDQGLEAKSLRVVSLRCGGCSAPLAGSGICAYCNNTNIVMLEETMRHR